MTIRLAQEHDLESMATIHADAWREAFLSMVDAKVVESLNKETRYKMWKNQWSLQTSRVFVWEKNGILRGFASLRPIKGDQADMEMNTLYVAPRFQGQGIGSQLFHHGKQEARASDYQTLKLWTLAGSLAKTFYEKHGGIIFEKTTTTIGGFTLPVDGYMWSLSSRSEVRIL